MSYPATESSTSGPFVCLSDLHLGADISVLSYHSKEDFTFRCERQSQCLKMFVQSLRNYIPRVFDGKTPVLVLNGDCLDFDFASPAQLIHAFQCFMRAAFDPNEEPLFASEVIYIPGNHDHRLWEQMKDQLMVRNIKQSNAIPERVQYQSTRLFDEEGIASFLLNEMIRMADLPNVSISLRYPNWGLKRGDKRIVFHHGHYCEGIYRVMSRLTEILLDEEVIDVEELEAQNGGWVDFLWSSLGASEDQKNIMVWMYAMSLDPAASHHNYKRIARIISDYLDREYSVSATSKVAAGMSLEKLIVTLLNITFGKVFDAERAHFKEVLSDGAIEGVSWYLSGPIHRQLCTEEGLELSASIDGDCRFVFGHTHKPFQAFLPVEGYSNNIGLYNSGGWSLDDVELTAVQGAAAIFIDEDFNIASLRLFNAPVNPRQDIDKYDVRIEGMNTLEDEKNPLLYQMRSALDNPECDALFREFNRLAKQKAFEIVKYKQKGFFDPSLSPGIKKEKSYDI